jgi:hypothetical protein
MSPLSFLSSAYSAVQNAVNNKGASLSQIGKDLQSGNVSGAEQTFASLLPPGMLPGNAGNGVSGPIATDLASLGKALSSGILSEAQSALSQLSTDLKTAAASLNHSGGMSHSAGGPGNRISYYANEAMPQGLNLLG